MAINPITGIDDGKPRPVSGLMNIAGGAGTGSNGLVPIPTPATSTGTPSATPPVTPSAQATPSTTTAASWNINDDQSVEKRIANIAKTDSPLMQQARTSANQQMNERGLMNSSMAVGAAQDAVIRAATPIATQDATIAANSAQFNASEANKASQFNANNLQQSSQFNTAETNKQNMQILDNDNRVKLAQMEMDYKELVVQNEGAAGLYDTYQKALNGILLNNTLDAANKQKAIDSTFAAMQDGMGMYSSIAGLNLGDILPGGTGSVGGTGTPGTPPPGSATAANNASAAADLLSRQSAWDAKKAAIPPGKGARALVERLGPRPT